MAYDERLAARVRALRASRTDVSERKMFGRSVTSVRAVSTNLSA